jgi:hypothetical protein
VDDISELEAGPSGDSMFHRDDRLSASEASELEARAARLAGTSHRARWNLDEEVPRHFLIPTDRDPELWAVRVKVSMYLRSMYCLTHPRLDSSLALSLKYTADVLRVWNSAVRKSPQPSREMEFQDTYSWKAPSRK